MYIHIHVYITATNEKEGQEFEREQGGVIRVLEGRKGKGKICYNLKNKRTSWQKSFRKFGSICFCIDISAI